MNKIKTSEEVLLETLNDMHEGNLADYLKDNPEELKAYSEPILKWGRDLVDAALKAAKRNAYINKKQFAKIEDFSKEFFVEGRGETYSFSIDPESILNAYPKELIQ